MKQIRISTISLIALAIMASSGCQHDHEKPILHVPQGKVGVVGFGSLMSLKAIEDVLERSYTDSTYQIHLLEYKRAWNFVGSTKDPKLPQELLDFDSYYIYENDTLMFDNIVFLNIIDHPGSKVNAILYFLSPNDLIALDRMEIGYERIDVTNNIEEFTIKGGEIYAYRALPNYTLTSQNKNQKNIIDESYYDLVIQACDSIGQHFRQEFNASTIPVDTLMVAPTLNKKKSVLPNA